MTFDLSNHTFYKKNTGVKTFDLADKQTENLTQFTVQ